MVTLNVGWEVSSYGYHGDDGNIFCASGVGKAYGPTYTVNDTVGCGVSTEDGSVFFTKNGQHLGTFCLSFLLFYSQSLYRMTDKLFIPFSRRSI